MTYPRLKWLLCLPALVIPAAQVSAASWICEQDGKTREVVVFYPDAPSRVPCKVFYAKPDENVVPRTLWEAINTLGYCERKAEDFVNMLASHGWQCRSAEPDE